MQKSFLIRLGAKIQTVVCGFLTQIIEKGSSNEDIHLRHYTRSQRDAEALLREYRLNPPKVREKRLLIVIPFRDKWAMTERCLKGLQAQEYSHLKILVALADNGSTESETVQGIARTIKEFAFLGIEVRHLRYDTAFNFSFLNNQALKDCKGFSPDILGMVNNDIEFQENSNLQSLVDGVDLPNAGAVGCTLLYPDRKIQHLFVFVGSKIVGSHPYKGRRVNFNSSWYDNPRAVGAVTGAVTFVKVTHFERVGGLDEALPTSYQDVDLCLKLQKLGLVNWVLPRVLLIHHETQTRSREPSWNEAEQVERQWGDDLIRNRFVSSFWSRKSEHFVLTPVSILRCLTSRGETESETFPTHPLT
ncbi:MAG: glycosyltransferase [Proteobacteria bacterium]|nr:MAG: glycosyltransferase [Pseudomonadota bacterium]